jgi:hypothetical protein
MRQQLEEATSEHKAAHDMVCAFAEGRTLIAVSPVCSLATPYHLGIVIVQIAELEDKLRVLTDELNIAQNSQSSKESQAKQVWRRCRVFVVHGVATALTHSLEHSLTYSFTYTRTHALTVAAVTPLHAALPAVQSHYAVAFTSVMVDVVCRQLVAELEVIAQHFAAPAASAVSDRRPNLAVVRRASPVSTASL